MKTTFTLLLLLIIIWSNNKQLLIIVIAEPHCIKIPLCQDNVFRFSKINLK